MAEDSGRPWWWTVGFVVLVIGALVGIIEFLSKPEADVKADVKYSVQYHPPGVRQLLLYGPPPSALEAVPDSLRFDRSAYRLYQEAWRITVRNEGEIAADSVVLNFPDADYATLDREGASVAHRPVTEGAVELGSIRPDRSVNLTIWSRHASSFWYLDAEEISISHRRGRGDVDYDRDVAEIFQWLDQHPLTSLGIAWLAWIGLAYLPDWFSDLREKFSSDQDEGGQTDS